MRISGGSAARLVLNTPKNATIRPTQDRIRQVIFSSLAERVPGARVLDLFAGTGSLGLEALSRGATHVTFVESHTECIACLRANVAACKFDPQSVTVVRQDTWQFLQAPSSPSFDLIFADPPYEKIRATLLDSPLLAAVRPWLAPGALFVWEHYSGQQIQAPQDWKITRQRTYGETGLTFWQLATETSSS